MLTIITYPLKYDTKCTLYIIIEEDMYVKSRKIINVFKNIKTDLIIYISTALQKKILMKN